MFFKKVDYNNNKECFSFLVNHFEYDTMNSWNALHSIANNVKIYNLPVDYKDAMEALEDDDWFTISQVCRDWEEDHPGYSVGFNGRSNGYLVLYNNQNNAHCFNSDPNNPCAYDNYEYWKKDIQESWGSLKAYHSTLVFYVKLVQEFDKLCDDLIDVLKELIERMKDRKRKTREFSATKRFERYYYDDVNNMNYHRKYMEDLGYHVWECDEDDLWAEYEMNEETKGVVVLEREN